MSALNGFHLVGVALTDLYTPFPNSKAPQQCFIIEVPNGDAAPFRFAIFLNPLSRLGDFASLKGKSVAVSGMLRGTPMREEGKMPITSAVAYDVRFLRDGARRRAGDYE